jgi:hypothetical protein
VSTVKIHPSALRKSRCGAGCCRTPSHAPNGDSVRCPSTVSDTRRPTPSVVKRLGTRRLASEQDYASAIRVESHIMRESRFRNGMLLLSPK